MRPFHRHKVIENKPLDFEAPTGQGSGLMIVNISTDSVVHSTQPSLDERVKDLAGG
jgi:hypothetical protein